METPKEVWDWLYESGTEKSRYHLDLVNVLDVKGGILLAIITLFAADPLHAFPAGGIANSHVPQILEYAYGTVLFIAALLSVAELWPRRYDRDPLPHEDVQWTERLFNHYEKHPARGQTIGESAKAEIVRAMVERIGVRVQKNQSLNAAKIWCLSRAFYFTVAAIAVYLIAAFTLKGL
ncbi:MAG TPA: hypothetical protein VGR97_09085 [Candidatus Acidoferrales bacterium]|nr:hypothetical protein [Candidatus Acidoferrales bacterium]